MAAYSTREDRPTGVPARPARPPLIRRSRGPLFVLLAAALALSSPRPSAAQRPFPVNPNLPEEARQFDFWIGVWDVNLRVRQEDLRWKDSEEAEARIYPILQGKAVLELWDGKRIKGFSLRYFDPEREKWVLWLNWPGRNRSGSSSLDGEFRHGRGEFFSVQRGPGGMETISRYTFSDITPTSLRWDDAYSSDGGRTWSNAWIMEFSRTDDLPALPVEGGEAHTYDNGGRCDEEPFRLYEFLAGFRTGQAEARDGDWNSLGAATLTGYRILDGCAVLVTLRWPANDLFAHITWNTAADRYEILTLDADPDSPARIYYSDVNAEDLLFVELGDDGPGDRRINIRAGTDGFVGWVHEARKGEGWQATFRARFGGE
jgi:hypothetical protein